MPKLPKGYLDMGCDEYAALDVDMQRAVFAKLREIVRYTMSADRSDLAIRCFMPVTPAEWIDAVKRVVCTCERCKDTGTYSWGACNSGRMTNSGPCARCGGDGVMTFDDMRRGRAYDKHAICAACR